MQKDFTFQSTFGLFEALSERPAVHLPVSLECAVTSQEENKYDNGPKHLKRVIRLVHSSVDKFLFVVKY